jgi:hypothetical protein
LRRQTLGFGLVKVDHQSDFGTWQEGQAQDANAPRLDQALDRIGRARQKLGARCHYLRLVIRHQTSPKSQQLQGEG